MYKTVMLVLGIVVVTIGIEYHITVLSMLGGFAFGCALFLITHRS